MRYANYGGRITMGWNKYKKNTYMMEIWKKITVRWTPQL